MKMQIDEPRSRASRVLDRVQGAIGKVEAILIQQRSHRLQHVDSRAQPIRQFGPVLTEFFSRRGNPSLVQFVPSRSNSSNSRSVVS